MMKGLFTIEVVARRISHLFTWLAMLGNIKSASAAILYLLYLGVIWFVILPNITGAATNFCNPIAVLGFFLTSKRKNNNDKKRNGYILHDWYLLGLVVRLFAFNIHASRGGYCRATRKADFINCDCARAGILDFFYLIRGWLVEPFVGYSVIENNIPYAFLPRIFFLFASNSGNKYQGDGNGYSFHNTQNINKALNGKVRQLGICVNNC